MSDAQRHGEYHEPPPSYFDLFPEVSDLGPPASAWSGGGASGPSGARDPRELARGVGGLEVRAGDTGALADHMRQTRIARGEAASQAGEEYVWRRGTRIPLAQAQEEDRVRLERLVVVMPWENSAITCVTVDKNTASPLQLVTSRRGLYSDICINTSDQLALRTLGYAPNGLTSLYSFSLYDLATLEEVQEFQSFPILPRSLRRDRQEEELYKSWADSGAEPICYDSNRNAYITTAPHALLMIGLRFKPIYRKQDRGFDDVMLHEGGIAYSAFEDVLAVTDIRHGACLLVRPGEQRILLTFGRDVLKKPSDVTFLQIRHYTYVVVADMSSHHVFVFGMEGMVRRVYGSEGSGDRELTAPSGVCVDPGGKVVVADTGNTRVVCFWTDHEERVDYWRCLLDQQELRAHKPLGVEICAPKDNLIVMTSGDTSYDVTPQAPSVRNISVYSGISAVMTSTTQLAPTLSHQVSIDTVHTGSPVTMTTQASVTTMESNQMDLSFPQDSPEYEPPPPYNDSFRENYPPIPAYTAPELFTPEITAPQPSAPSLNDMEPVIPEPVIPDHQEPSAPSVALYDAPPFVLCTEPSVSGEASQQLTTSPIPPTPSSSYTDQADPDMSATTPDTVHIQSEMWETSLIGDDSFIPPEEDQSMEDGEEMEEEEDVIQEDVQEEDVREIEQEVPMIWRRGRRIPLSQAQEEDRRRQEHQQVIDPWATGTLQAQCAVVEKNLTAPFTLQKTQVGDYTDMCVNKMSHLVLRSVQFDRREYSVYSFTLHNMADMRVTSRNVMYPSTLQNRRVSRGIDVYKLQDRDNEAICYDVVRDCYITTAPNAVILVGRSQLEVISAKDDVNFSRFNLSNTCVTYSPDEDVIACMDTNTHAVLLIRPLEKRILLMFGSDHFKAPQSLDFLRMRHHTYLVVSDTGNHCVKVCNMAGDVKKVYGYYGNGAALLTSPTGICIDPNGKIVVCDRGNCRVVCYWTDNQGGGQDYWQCLLDKDDLEGLAPVRVQLCPALDTLIVMTSRLREGQQTHVQMQKHACKVLVFTGLAAVMTAAPVIRAPSGGRGTLTAPPGAKWASVRQVVVSEAAPGRQRPGSQNLATAFNDLSLDGPETIV